MTPPLYRASHDAPKAYPHLSDSLRKAADSIFDRWEAAVRRDLAGADGPTFAELRQLVPKALLTLADIVGNGVTGITPAPALASDTSVQALPPSYRIDEAMTELGLLRRTVFEELPRLMGRSLSGTEAVVLNEHMDFIVRRTVVAHSEHIARQLQEANEGQSKYLSFVSHDLRGGLNGIFLMVEVLRRELAGRPELAETLEDLELMRRSILETVATMDRFLYAERFRKGKVRVRTTPMSLRTLVSEIGSRFIYAAKEQGTELTTELADRADIVSDRELLALALHGIVANAVRYTTRGTVRLTGKPREDGAGWRLVVIDSGSGIEPAALERIRAGFRDPTPGQPGAGLGLSLASQAARLIGATLGAESTFGKGSQFWIDVPCSAGST
jgi:signal transduction histidine kinase